MDRFNGSSVSGGWRRVNRLSQPGIFLAEGIRFPFEAVDETVGWASVDLNSYAGGAFWEALVREPEVFGSPVWSLSKESIRKAANGLDRALLFEHLSSLEKETAKTQDAFVVLAWLNIQIETEVFYGMINLISDALFQKKDLSRAG